MTTKQPRNTRQRQAIYQAIEQAARPLTPQEVLHLAQQDVVGLGIATVYRNLKSLLDEDCIQAVELPAEATRYELARTTHAHQHHHHFLCTQCERAFDVHGCVGNFAHMVPDGFKMHDHEMTLYGYCKDCAQKGVK